MAYLEELLPEFRKGAKIRRKCWSEGMCIPSEGQFDLNFTEYDARSDDWELYKDPEPDWDYIIKNKCLCWFWDDISTNVKEIGFLENIFDDEDGEYYASNGTPYNNCRPVRRDEVTFYEDKKDE